MSKEETVEVTLRLPKALVDFIGAMEGDVQKYLERCIVDLHLSYVEAVDAEKLMELFHLKPVFKAYNVLPGYYVNP